MSGVDIGGPAAPPVPAVSRQAARERRRGGSHGAPSAPGGGARPPRSRGTTLAWALATLVFVAGLGVLGWQGYRTGLDLRGGSSLDAPRDPTAPGYEAQVRPTQVHLVTHQTAGGTIGDVWLLVEGPDRKGGAVIVVPSVMVVAPEGMEAQNLERLAKSGGLDKVREAVERAVGLGVTDATEVPYQQMVELMSVPGGISFTNPDTVVQSSPNGDRQIVHAAGSLTLEGADAVAYLDRYSDGENQIKRHSRGQVLVEAWLAALAKKGGAPSLDAAQTGGVDLTSIVDDLAAGPVTVTEVPLEAVPIPGASGFNVFRPAASQMPEFVSRLVPFPASAFPGQRARTRILDGVPDPAKRLEAALPVVAAGGEVIILGNASSFGRTATTVEYHDPSKAQAATAIAARFGVTATQSPNQTDAYDVTVTLGSDASR